MSDKVYTPGPHRAERISGTSGQYLITDGKKHLALVPSGANARLYAAAPDMYEALEAAVSEYGKPGGPWNVPSEPGTWIDKARAALTKARGEKIPQPVEENQEELF